MKNELPDHLRKILNSYSNGSVGQAYSTKEAILWNVFRTEELTKTIEKLDKTNKDLQEKVYYLTIIAAFLAAVQVLIGIASLCSKP